MKYPELWKSGTHKWDRMCLKDLKRFLGDMMVYCSSYRVVYWIGTVISCLCPNIMLTSPNIFKSYDICMNHGIQHTLHQAHIFPHETTQCDPIYCGFSAVRRPSTGMTWVCFRDFWRISKIKKPQVTQKFMYPTLCNILREGTLKFIFWFFQLTKKKTQICQSPFRGRSWSNRWI